MLSDELVRQLVAGFRPELEEYLTEIHRALTSLEREGYRADALNEAFRAVHNLKGAASAIGLESMAGTAHSLESLLEAVRSRTREADAIALDLGYNGLQLIGRLFEEEDEAAVSGYQEAVRCWLSGMAEPAAPAPAVGLEPQRPAPLAGSRQAADSVRISLTKLDNLLAQIHDMMLARHRAARLSQAVEDLAEELRRLHQRSRNSAPSPQALADLERAAARLQRDAKSDTMRLELTLASVQKHAQDMRMLPVQSLFDPLERQVHEVARRLGKVVQLECQGGQVEVDRQVLEAVKEPLGHLLRNAVDHGLETPQARLAGGKNEQGSLQVTAALEGNLLHLLVRDDGAGIDAHRVRERARQLGLEIPGEESEVYELLFQPGFSTRQEASETSGRGVGLDVVRLHVERLGGRVEVSSHPGQGTEFQLRLPIHLSTMRVVTFHCGGQTFALPTLPLERAMRIQPGQLGRVAGHLSIQLDGVPVPVLSLKAVLGLTAAGQDERLGLLLDVGKRFLLLADEIEQELEIVVQPLGPWLKDLPYYSGGSITADNRVMLLLNPSGLIGWQSPAYVVESEPLPAPPARVLVVDDSITTRTLQKSILEAAGYTVVVACDGQEALALLATAAFDLVISDIEMPTLNGIELTRRIKQAPELKHLPVMLVSSLGSTQDRERGAQAGADAYVCKGQFDQVHFLDLVESLL